MRPIYKNTLFLVTYIIDKYTLYSILYSLSALLIVFKEMWTLLTMNLGMKTTF